MPTESEKSTEVSPNRIIMTILTKEGLDTKLYFID